jgi:hypothetical protein
MIAATIPTFVIFMFHLVKSESDDDTPFSPEEKERIPFLTMPRAPFILLINPWITDFAAYDMWARPLGLLQIASLLAKGGCEVALIDCMDRNDAATNHRTDVLPPTFQRFHTGKYPKMPIPVPEAIADIPRRYYRYGIHPESLRSRLEDLPRPDLVMTTCQMTYWYPGLQQTISGVREVFGDVPVWLGGTYARLCRDHASRFSGADRVFTGPLRDLPGLVHAATGYLPDNQEMWASLANAPSPAIELSPSPEVGPLLTSLGCPYHCPYCASGLLQPKWERRKSQTILDEIIHWNSEFGIEDFAFFDDALLIDSDQTLRPVLERIAAEGPRVRFHTPNAVHIRPLSAEWSRLLRASGFETIRLGLETTREDKQATWGGKTDTGSFLSAVNMLSEAGFERRQIGAYLLCGLPGQTPEEVAESIDEVIDAGAQPHLCEYSPIPGTAIFEQVRKECAFDLLHEPLTHNNSFFACRRPGFSYEDLIALKQKVRLARRTAIVL